MDQTVCSNIPYYVVWIAFGVGLLIGGILGPFIMYALKMSRDELRYEIDTAQVILENATLKDRLKEERK